MEQMTPLLPLPPLTNDVFPPEMSEVPLAPDIQQLIIDVANVEQHRVNIASFPPEYQERIKTYYRFSGTIQNTKIHNPGKVNRDTLDTL